MTRLHRLGAAAVVLLVCSTAACSKEPSEQAGIPGTTTGAGMEIGFRSEADPPTAGNNAFEVTVSKDGSPISDAKVDAVFSMPAMPAMNMPAMRTSATLTPAGGGRYRGTGQLSMAGTWSVQVTVARNGQELGTKSLSIVAK